MSISVAIVGHHGFVGSAFFEAFSADKNYAATGIDRENYAKHAGKKFSILINANGNSNKRLADSDPAKDWGMNVAATERMLRDFPCEHYIHLSTVEVYNDKSSLEKTREDAAIDPLLLSNYGKSKYAGEQVAKTHPSFLILRLAGMVGKNMKKGPAYDILQLGKLFISEKSRLHFMNTKEVALVAKSLAEKGKWGEIYNVVGKGSIRLSELAEMAGVELSKAGNEICSLCISTEKIEKAMEMPSTANTLKGFLAKQA